MPFYLLLIGSLSMQYVLVCNTELFLLGQKCATDDVEYCLHIGGRHNAWKQTRELWYRHKRQRLPRKTILKIKTIARQNCFLSGGIIIYHKHLKQLRKWWRNNNNDSQHTLQVVMPADCLCPPPDTTIQSADAYFTTDYYDNFPPPPPRPSA